ncbi:MAG: flavodoxin family protein [Spirochaetales bacterium]|nr:flavodoxin family protein [Spirochaetales bacterium]
MLRVVFLNGSARPDGNTAHLMSLITERLDTACISANVINISELNINYCKGCHRCEQTRSCVQQDDMELIYKAFYAADLICIASPSYWGDVTGQLKVFFDRSTPYCDTVDGTSIFPAGKSGCALAIRAGRNRAESEAVIASIEHYYSHLGIEPQFSESFEAVRNHEDLAGPESRTKISDFAAKIRQIESDMNLFVV